MVIVMAKAVPNVPGKEADTIPNRSYQRGVRFERERLKHYKELGHEALRTAGSHGKFDIISIDDKHGIVNLIQCKVTNDLSTANRLLKRFREAPPLQLMSNIHQTMEVKITGSTEVHSVTV